MITHFSLSEAKTSRKYIVGGKTNWYNFTVGQLAKCKNSFKRCDPSELPIILLGIYPREIENYTEM